MSARHLAVLLVGSLLFAGVAGLMVFAEPLRIGYDLPLDCTPGETCFVQKYVDVDPTDAIADHTCGRMTSPEHRGTDFRVPPGADVAVVAVADGMVRRVRDGEPDRSFLEPLTAPDARACGNGIAIEHADGSESLYCHLAQGSIEVGQGESVTRGQRLGTVGASGLTEFTHVEWTLTRDGVAIDPFTGHRQGRAACGTPGEALWSDAVGAALAEAGRTHALIAGFAPAPVTIEAIEEGALAPVTDEANALVAYGLAIGLREGDTLRLLASGPGLEVDETHVMDRAQAQHMRFAGRRLADGLAPGTYEATFTVERGGVLVSRTAASLTLP